MSIEDYLKECRVNPDEKISTSDDSFWTMKDIIQSYIEEEELVKNNIDLGNVSDSFTISDLHEFAEYFEDSLELRTKVIQHFLNER